MNEVTTIAIENVPAEEKDPRREIAVIKIANGYVIAPHLYCGDIEKIYAADVDAALSKAKEFLI